MTVMVEVEVRSQRTGCSPECASRDIPGTFCIFGSRGRLLPLSPVRRASGLTVSAQPVNELPEQLRRTERREYGR